MSKAVACPFQHWADDTQIRSTCHGVRGSRGQIVFAFEQDAFANLSQATMREMSIYGQVKKLPVAPDTSNSVKRGDIGQSRIRRQPSRGVLSGTKFLNYFENFVRQTWTVCFRGSGQASLCQTVSAQDHRKTV